MRVLLLASTFLILVCSVAAASLKEGLVLYFTYENVKGDTVKDMSGHGNDGVMSGGAKITKDGKYGDALDVSTSSDAVVTVEHDESLDAKDAVTCMAWMYLTVRDQVGCAKILEKDFSRPAAPYISYGLALNCWAPNNPAFEIITQGSIKGPRGTRQPEAEKWIHFAGVYDGKEARLYIDGKVEGKLAVTGKIDESKGNLYIGHATVPVVAEPFNGYIDEVAVYNRALSDAELKLAMEGNLLPVEPKDKLAISWGRIKNRFFGNVSNLGIVK